MWCSRTTTEINLLCAEQTRPYQAKHADRGGRKCLPRLFTFNRLPIKSRDSFALAWVQLHILRSHFKCWTIFSHFSYLYGSNGFFLTVHRARDVACELKMNWLRWMKSSIVQKSLAVFHFQLWESVKSINWMIKPACAFNVSQINVVFVLYLHKLRHMKHVQGAEQWNIACHNCFDAVRLSIKDKQSKCIQCEIRAVLQRL